MFAHPQDVHVAAPAAAMREEIQAAGTSQVLADLHAQFMGLQSVAAELSCMSARYHSLADRFLAASLQQQPPAGSGRVAGDGDGGSDDDGVEIVGVTGDCRSEGVESEK